MTEETSTFYRAEPEERREDIREDGIDPGDAPECRECGTGIHVTTEEFTAKQWAKLLDWEREVFAGESSYYDIWKVEIDETENRVVEDHIPEGGGIEDAWIICRDEPIPPEQIELIVKEREQDHPF